MNDGAGRVPPSSLDAEAAVLSAVLLNGSALDEVPFLESKHFYADANRRIYQAAVDLREQGSPIDVVSVAGYLRDREKLQAVGGSPYLAQLSDATPAVAHVEAHAKEIVTKWEVRQIIFTAQQIATEGYGDIGDVEQWKQEVDRKIQNVVQSKSSDKHLMLAGEATKEAMTVVMQRFERKGVILTGVTTGMPTLDARFGGLEACKNYVFAARPGLGKTALVTGIILSVAKGKRKGEIGDGCVFVSLEMPRIQIMFRFLSQLSRVDSVKIQRGKLDAEEIHRLKQAAETLATLPIAIEDSSDHTPASLRAAFREGQRKLWEKHGKKLNVKALGIDYLQLMGSERESHNREAEIAAVSRSCKAIAKSEGIAVMTLAQVNRDCEKRPDKRPILADLRECLHGDTLVLNADTGERVSIRDIAQKDLRFQVWAVNDRLKMTKRPIQDAWCAGRKMVYRVTLRSGRTIQATLGHRFLTIDGWRELRHIKTGTELAVPRHYEANKKARTTMSSKQSMLLGWLIGNGWFGGSPTVTTTTLDDAQILVRLAKQCFPLKPVIKPEHLSTTAQKVVLSMGYMCGAKKNPLTRWLRDLGLWAVKSPKKFVPDEVFLQNPETVAAFLRGIFHADGTCTQKLRAKSIIIKFATTSQRLAAQVQHLLLRLGIVAHLRDDHHGRGRIKSRYDKIWSVHITNRVAAQRFMRVIGFVGNKDRVARSKLVTKTNDAGQVDRIPRAAAALVRQQRERFGLSASDVSWRDQGKRMSRATAARLGTELKSQRLSDLGNSDVLWDEVRSIERCGVRQTYDLTVGTDHSFAAADFLTHNSGAIEQDADVVTFIYRDDVYKKDDAEKDNKAELIVRKLRDNGGPGTVHVNFNPTTMSFFEGINRPDLDQLGDIFDDGLPLNQDPIDDWHDSYDR